MGEIDFPDDFDSIDARRIDTPIPPTLRDNPYHQTIEQTCEILAEKIDSIQPSQRIRLSIKIGEPSNPLMAMKYYTYKDKDDLFRAVLELFERARQSFCNEIFVLKFNILKDSQNHDLKSMYISPNGLLDISEVHEQIQEACELESRNTIPDTPSSRFKQ